MSEFIENKFWVVLPYDMVRGRCLALQLSACSGQRRTRPQSLAYICDHSWDFGWPAVNETTMHWHAPPEAMQFGQALAKNTTTRYGTRTLNTDQSDSASTTSRTESTACFLQRLGLPSAWDLGPTNLRRRTPTRGYTDGLYHGVGAESPPSFSTMSETVCDRANQRFQIAASDLRTTTPTRSRRSLDGRPRLLHWTLHGPGTSKTRQATPPSQALLAVPSSSEPQRN